MPRRRTGVDPSGYAKRYPPTCGWLDIAAAHEHRRTTKAAPRARFVVCLNDDVLYVNRNLQLARKPLHSYHGLHAVATITAANYGDLSVRCGVGSLRCLDHVSPAECY